MRKRREKRRRRKSKKRSRKEEEEEEERGILDKWVLDWKMEGSDDGLQKKI